MEEVLMDSFVWRQSAERNKMNLDFCAGRTSTWLLGDSGYPLEPFLITPYRNTAENSPEANFNKIHSKARSIVERCIGCMKTRWRCVLEERKLRYSPKKSSQIINVCAALHNPCTEQNVPLPEERGGVLPQNSIHPQAENVNGETAFGLTFQEIKAALQKYKLSNSNTISALSALSYLKKAEQGVKSEIQKCLTLTNQSVQ